MNCSKSTGEIRRFTRVFTVAIALGLSLLPVGCGSDEENANLGTDASDNDGDAAANNLDGADVADVAVPILGLDHLCDPCTKDSDCAGGTCIAVGTPAGSKGSFCTSVCKIDSDCGTGYKCLDKIAASGSVCVPEKAECACSDAAKKAKLQTACFAASLDADGKVVGKCGGVRTCGDIGLSVCDAPNPATETCNGVDDDCNGTTDDINASACDDLNACTDDSCDGKACAHAQNTKACDDSSACTKDDICTLGSCAGAAIVCDDANVCTDDSCDKKSGCVNVNNVLGCNDNNKCTEKDTCAVGLCAGATVSCDDKNPCTDEACDVATGCSSTINTVGCTDGDGCTLVDLCVGGKCVPGEKLDCDDKNPCTKDSCDSKTGECLHPAIADDTVCTDNSVCTTGDACKGGLCIGKAIVCDDAELCTKDSCDPATGCTVTNLDGLACDDENLCTVGDACAVGKCVSGKGKECKSAEFCIESKCNILDGKCKLTAKAAGVPCTDGTACTEKDVCADGSCVGQGVNCDDKNPCTQDSCDLATGCGHSDSNQPCDDGNKCTVGDLCNASACVPGGPLKCDDGNPCTQDACDGTSGLCAFKNLDTPCDDGSSCTTGEVCNGGACVGKAISCDDGNPCSDDGCDAKLGCTHVNNTAPCNDANACTDFDVCAAGECAGKKIFVAIYCDDGNICTNDGCDKKFGCVNTSNLELCNDGNICTVGDSCKDTVCLPGPNVCSCQTDVDCKKEDDGNFCNGTLFCDKSNGLNKCKVNPATIITCPTGNDNECQSNECDPPTGKCALAAQNEAKPCDADGSVCTVGDICKSGLCTIGPLQTCDDGNGCTSDSCDPKAGCLHTANATPCDADQNACTVGDVCADKVCQKGPLKQCSDGQVCTLDSCDIKTGNCVFDAVAQEGAACDADGSVCTIGDTCKAGVCAAGKAANCDDANPCTNDSCDNKLGCQNVANTAACDADKDACTVGDVCADKVCLKGKATTCDDGNLCTSDACDAASGNCLVANLATPCNDGSVCTTEDVCTNGACVGVQVQCDDKNPCTNDVCDPKQGCTYTNNTVPCDDKNACTDFDICGSGACKGTPKVPATDCADGNDCTDDTCDPATGCVHTNNTAPCDDGNKCTNADKCAAGKCVGGASICACQKDSDCAGQEDGNFCNGTLICSNNKCAINPASVIVCNASGDNACTKNTCTPLTGKCAMVSQNEAGPCSDSSVCTQGDICKAGACIPGAQVNCDDGNLCSNDSCDAISGCVHTANALPCNADSNLCTVGDACALSACKAGPAKDCNDKNACTNDSCTKATGNCVNDAGALQFQPCNDGNACTTGDVCLAGTCTPQGNKNCNDFNVCTDNACDPVKDCVFTANVLPCNADNNACTVGDTCAASVCVAGAAKVCNDNLPCTQDSCSTQSGNCSFQSGPLDGKSCDFDQSVCTVNDFCNNGLCNAGPKVNCGDGNVCTDDTCDAVKGCQHGANTAGCNADNNACTVSDVCAAKVCTPGPVKNCDDLNVCTVDSCKTQNGDCSHNPQPLIGSVCALGKKCSNAGVCQ